MKTQNRPHWQYDWGAGQEVISEDRDTLVIRFASEIPASHEMAGCAEDGRLQLLVDGEVLTNWDTYTYDEEHADAFGTVLDYDGDYVGIPCPNCNTPVFFENAQQCDEVWGHGYEVFLVCPDEACQTLVFLSPEIRAMLGLDEGTDAA